MRMEHCGWMSMLDSHLSMVGIVFLAWAASVLLFYFIFEHMLLGDVWSHHVVWILGGSRANIVVGVQ